MSRPKINDEGMFGLIAGEIEGRAMIVSDAGITIRESRTGEFHFVEWHELTYFIPRNAVV